MKRTLLSGVAAAAAIGLGCATSRSTTGQAVPGKELLPASRILVMGVQDVVEKGEGTIGGSGEAVATAIRDDLMKHKYTVVTTDVTALSGAFGEAMALNAD